MSRRDLYGRDVPELLTRTALVEALHLDATDEALEMIRRTARRTEPEPELEAVSLDPSSADAAASAAEVVSASEPAPIDESAEISRIDDDFIIGAPLSEERVQQFFGNYIEDRRRAGTVETLFRLAGSLERRVATNDAFAFGFNILIFKGPFVEGSNWLSAPTWDFAIAMERSLLSMLVQRMDESAELEQSQVQLADWPAVLDMATDLATGLRRDGYRPAALILTGEISVEQQVELVKAPGVRLKSPTGLDQPWVLGTWVQQGNVPVIHFTAVSPGSAAAMRPAVFILDLGRFGSLIQHGEPVFRLTPFTEAEARKLLASNPELIASPPPGADEEERVRQMLLRVHLRLFESYELRVADRVAVRGIRLRPA